MNAKEMCGLFHLNNHGIFNTTIRLIPSNKKTDDVTAIVI